MGNFLLVGAGGFIGSIGRYMLSEAIMKVTNNHPFPFWTLSANVIGCLLIGVMAGFVELKGSSSEPLRLFVVMGILGGFTTFSTFSHETIVLFKGAQFIHAYLNIILSVTLCLCAAWFGYWLTKFS